MRAEKYGGGNHAPNENGNPLIAYQMSQSLVAPYPQRVRWNNFLYHARNQEKYRQLMNEEELAAYNKLPMVFTVYRGIRSSCPLDDVGFSWTRSYKVAKWFSDNRGNKSEPPVILKQEVSKSDVVWVLFERDEEEVVIAPKGTLAD